MLLFYPCDPRFSFGNAGMTDADEAFFIASQVGILIPEYSANLLTIFDKTPGSHQLFNDLVPSILGALDFDIQDTFLFLH